MTIATITVAAWAAVLLQLWALCAMASRSDRG
jgi:hypothetical protein